MTLSIITLSQGMFSIEFPKNVPCVIPERDTQLITKKIDTFATARFCNNRRKPPFRDYANQMHTASNPTARPTALQIQD